MVSNTCHYALKAMLELARREDGGPVSIAEIAASRQIPTRFLEAIMRQLKQAGLAESARGKKGGYRLGRPAREINAGQVIRLFEGPLVAPPSEPEPGRAVDVLGAMWQSAEQAVSALYAEHDFRRLADREKAAEERAAGNFMI